ncbi:MAG: hypothetical protein K2N03_02590 [Muribaculaceae bacterium]|nr:hypothetical protein [Muribaculaceae bacterium]
MNRTTVSSLSVKEKVISFVWQHILLLISLFLMTFGVALCIRSALGSSVISSIPLAMTLAGEAGKAPALTIGDYTNIMNVILVFCQFLLLRRKFELIQLFQLVIGTVFGILLDVCMFLTEFISNPNLLTAAGAQIVGCIILGIGIAFEVKCGSVTMPGEGMPAAISKLTGIPFAKAKIMVDISLVIIAVVIGFAYFGKWLWVVIGPGTLFAMIFVGIVVRFITPHISWFDHILCYRPGFRRYIYGLARYTNKIILKK